MSEYVYPATIFVKTVSLKSQIEKVESEVFEAHQLLGRKNPNLFQVAVEVEDAIQALETLRRNLQENHEVFVNKARAKVLKKNQNRKVYSGEV